MDAQETWLKHLSQAKHHASNAEKLRQHLEVQLKQWSAQIPAQFPETPKSPKEPSGYAEKIIYLQQNIESLEASTKAQKALADGIAARFLELGLLVNNLKARGKAFPELHLPMRDEETGTSDEEVQVRETKQVKKGEDEEGNKLINEYCVLSDLGRGAFGKVKLVVHNPTDKLYAIKIINTAILGKKHNSVDLLLDLQREVAVMKKLRHRHIVTLHEVIEDLDGGKLYLILDFVEKGAVRAVDAEGRLVGEVVAEPLLREYLAQIVDAMKHLHRRRIIHRDLKPENILLTESGEIRIADFGKAIKPEGQTTMVSCQGTPAYMPPEAVRGEKEYDGTSQDIWSLGVTLYTLACGKLPFHRDSYPAMAAAIQGDEPDYPDTLSPEARDLLRGMMQKDPRKRFNLDHISVHPFLNGVKLNESASLTSDSVELSEHEIRNAIKSGRGMVLADRISLMVKIKQRVNRIRARIAKKHAEAAAAAAQSSPPASPTVAVVEGTQ